jgi:hypothetical protein
LTGLPPRHFWRRRTCQIRNNRMRRRHPRPGGKLPSRPACATGRGDEASNAVHDTRATVALARGCQMGLVVV